MFETFLQEMSWRGLIHQVTHEAELAKFLSTGPRRAYVGFDPTAPSLTIGNLMGIMTLRRFQDAGHQPVVIMGGGTGQIGDPSGKSAERMLMTRETVEANVQAQRKIFDALIDFAPSRSNHGVLFNNAQWLGKISYLDALRDIGKFFSVNAMIQRDSVRERLNNRDQGISYTEFSYMILQSYDYYHLWKDEGVALQMGGSDQWGNIVSGIDLIRRYTSADAVERQEETKVDAFAFTWPLVTKADGTKFGKSESGAVWLTADRTSPYEYYQFWLNAADADVVRFLKFFTLLPREQVEALEQSVQTNPGAREAQRTLAREATKLLHGEGESLNAENAAKALFSGDIGGLSEATLRQVLAGVASSKLDRTRLEDAGVSLLDLLIETKLAASKREAKEFLASGSVSVNGRKAGADESLTTKDLLHGRLTAIRRGKKNWHLVEWA
jgi:tyrosyl-tRNA synthetase